MPPRFNYWTIIFGNQPTSFRAATREELLPTFKQIQAKHTDAVMMWFAHGRLWKSEEEAAEARRQRFGDPGARKPRPEPERRGRDWRPGGQHKDPRDRFNVPRDVKRARFKSQLQRDRFRPRDPQKPRPDSGEFRPPRPDFREQRGPRGPRPDNRDRPDQRGPRGPRPDDRDRRDQRGPRGPRPDNRDQRDQRGPRGPRPDNRDRRDQRGPRGPRPENRDQRGPRPDSRNPRGPRGPRPFRKKDEDK